MHALQASFLLALATLDSRIAVQLTALRNLARLVRHTPVLAAVDVRVREPAGGIDGVA